MDAMPANMKSNLDQTSKVRRRTRVKQWMKRHHISRNKDRIKAKKGCPELHTSTTRVSRLNASPRMNRLFNTHPPFNSVASPLSFHSCYSYERESYSWWWVTTLQEVARNWLYNGTTRVASILRMNPSETQLAIASYNGSIAEGFTPGRFSDFTPHMSDQEFGHEFFAAAADLLPPAISPPNLDASFWESGYEYINPEYLKDIKALPNDFPMAGRDPNAEYIYTPPIHPTSALGWSKEDESRLEFISLSASPAPESPDEQTRELIMLAESMRGHWITHMSRSSNIDQQFKYLGLTYVKRNILSRIAIPLSLFLEGEQSDGTFSNLQTWIHTPLGLRHNNWSTCGEISFDSDPDCGDWEGFVRAITIYLPSVERSVRALQRIVKKPGRKDLGISIDTRCVLPDAVDGKVLLFQIDTFPNAFQVDYMAGSFHTTRVLRYEHPVDNVRELSSKTALTESGSLMGCTRLPNDKDSPPRKLTFL